MFLCYSFSLEKKQFQNKKNETEKLILKDFRMLLQLAVHLTKGTAQ